MTQNKSHAVMAQRSEPHDSLDDFPTPPWAARALCEHVILHWIELHHVAWEPACNRGYLVKGLNDYFKSVLVSDVHNYGLGKNMDFLMPYIKTPKADWIVTNPPFRLAEQFVIKANEQAAVGTAMLVRTQFLESVGRFQRLFSQNPPNIIAQFCERVPMVKGRIDQNVSTATSYCWIVWIRGCHDTRFTWIPPCRKQLEREGDYD